VQAAVVTEAKGGTSRGGGNAEGGGRESSWRVIHSSRKQRHS